MTDRSELVRDIATAINRNSAERLGGDTADFILAEYLVDCLESYGQALAKRKAWYEPSSDGVLEEVTTPDASKVE